MDENNKSAEAMNTIREKTAKTGKVIVAGLTKIFAVIKFPIMKFWQGIKILAIKIGGKIKGKASQTLDVNGDGVIDAQDMAQMAENVSNAAHKTAESAKKKAKDVKSNMEKKVKERELRTYAPIYLDTVKAEGYEFTRLIRICDVDRYYEADEQLGAPIGYYTNRKMRVVNIFRKGLSELSLSFYPDSNYEFYYVDPYNRNLYVAIDCYFERLNKIKISEIQKVAQDLGARHFMMTVKKIGENKPAGLFIHKKDVSSVKETVDVSLDIECLGQEPVKPVVRYLQQDETVTGLIALRMDKKAPISKQHFVIRLGDFAGMNIKDAASIDALMKKYKYKNGKSVLKHLKETDGYYLEYDIEF